MALYELTTERLQPISKSSFADLGVGERTDLQRMLRLQPQVLGEDLYILAEEFGDWEDSQRRIDLLAIDREANLVVIELKRTNDGGHADLQALRYAAMVSTMTFDQAVEAHRHYRAGRNGADSDAQEDILESLDWEHADDGEFGQDVRILLVAADFSKELTTSVLWLSEQGIDIRCIRLTPYRDGDRRLIDVQVIIPLPEAVDYQVRIRAKERSENSSKQRRHDARRRFWDSFLQHDALCTSGYAASHPGSKQWLGIPSGEPGIEWGFHLLKDQVQVMWWAASSRENLSRFERLYSQREAIDQAFGDRLGWKPFLNNAPAQIWAVLSLGGYHSPEEEWPEIHAGMLQALKMIQSAIGRVK
jgi:hypothetical protein